MAAPTKGGRGDRAPAPHPSPPAPRCTGCESCFWTRSGAWTSFTKGSPVLRVTLHPRAFSARAALTASLTLWMVPHTTTRPFLGPKRPRLSPAGPTVSRLSSPWGRAEGSDLLGVSGSDPPAPGPSPLLLCAHHAPAAGQVICLPETLLKLPMVLSVKSNLLTEPTKPTLMAAPMPRSPRPVPQPPSSNTAASFPRRDLRLAGRRLRLA